MPADKFLSYSKFNKKYFNPYYLDNRLPIIYPVTCLLAERSLDILQSYYKTPDAFPSNFYAERTSKLTEEEKLESIKMKDEVHSISYTINKIYPFDINSFVDNYFSNTLPSERSFIVESMVKMGKIIPRNGYLLLSSSPFTKEEYDQIKSYWLNNYSISTVIKNLKNIQTIVDNHKKDLRYLALKNDELILENENLKKINNDLSNQVYRSTFTTWT